MPSSSSVHLPVTGENLNSLPVNENHQNRSSRTEYTVSSSSSSSSSSRNSSFGSLSFFSNPENSPSPIHSIFNLRNSGVPFSWEQHPGIPKKSSNLSKKENSSSTSALILLPLPPASCSNLSKRFSFDALFAIRKKNQIEIIRKDPFVAALMKCSKGNQDSIVKHSKSSLNVHRFGLDIIGCKNSCSVTESNVLKPKYSRKEPYDLLNRRSG